MPRSKSKEAQKPPTDLDASTQQSLHTVVIASGNRHKLTEVQAMFREATTGLKIRTIREWDHRFSVAEDADSFAENARRKAQAAQKLCHLPVLADDSGLEVAALKGLPGVHSHYYAGPEATDNQNIRKLLESLKKVAKGKRQARYVCHLLLLMPDGEEFSVEEGVDGEILPKSSGIGGFGYDPLFYLKEQGCTMAELSTHEKNRLSHRAMAFASLIKKLRKVGLID